MPKTKSAEEKPIGEITHYYSNLGVGIIKLKAVLKVGDKIKLVGATSNFEQEVESIQIEHKQVQTAKKGDVVGIKVKDKVREGDLVYKVD
ncbi:translation elongation factor-like protein [Candidatus Parcubacteria bacterium]|nr:MAG: translation elongation factor-like protein [Candidatus Parcubacteria bacterium]